MKKLTNCKYHNHQKILPSDKLIVLISAFRWDCILCCKYCNSCC